MSPEGKLRVVVRSRKVPIRTIELRRPLYSASGLQVGAQTSQALLFAPAFDDSHKKAIEEARKLSCDLGLEFEVVDRSRSNPFRRLISVLVREMSAGPSVVLTPLSGSMTRGSPTEMPAAPR